MRSALVVCLLGISLSVAAQERNIVVSRADTPALQEQRVALVIGNSAYLHAPLRNPVNDAQDIAAKLKALNFDVIERRNLQTKQIGSTLRAFRSKLKPGAVALVFYAGHGLQIKGDNYLPAVDADISSEEDVPNQSLAVRQVMDVLEEAKTRVNLVFLDACRNNPYARSFRSTSDGLARVNAPSGTLISFATRPGSVASDGTGRNGLYTDQLLRQMDQVGVPIEQVLKRVLSGVKSTSQGRQEPWMEGSLEGDFYFRGGPGIAQVASLAPASIANASIAAAQPVPYHEAGKRYKDCPECPVVITIPGGTFTMGSMEIKYADPEHQVSVRPFAISKTEITRTQWKAFMEEDPSNFSTRGLFPMCTDECPVEQVTWQEARDYAKRLSEKTGKRYRLPTEVEWEYACLGGEPTKYCGSDQLDSVGWVQYNGGSGTKPVGQLRGNRFGLQDMTGNVSEWVEDCWNPSYDNAPTDGTAWQEGDCSMRVSRGGGMWLGRASSEARARYGRKADLRWAMGGFRVVRELD